MPAVVRDGVGELRAAHQSVVLTAAFRRSAPMIEATSHSCRFPAQRSGLSCGGQALSARKAAFDVCRQFAVPDLGTLCAKCGRPAGLTRPGRAMTTNETLFCRDGAAVPDCGNCCCRPHQGAGGGTTIRIGARGPPHRALFDRVVPRDGSPALGCRVDVSHDISRDHRKGAAGYYTVRGARGLPVQLLLKHFTRMATLAGSGAAAAHGTVTSTTSSPARLARRFDIIFSATC